MHKQWTYIQYVDLCTKHDSVAAILADMKNKVIYLALCITGIDDIETVWSKQKAKEVVEVLYQSIEETSVDNILKRKIAQEQSPYENHEIQSYVEITPSEDGIILFFTSIELGYAERTLETKMNRHIVREIADVINDVIKKLDE